MFQRSETVIIIGGGHNALAAAFYLAKAGLNPLVLEKREVVGGAAVTEELWPGFRCSTLAHTCGPMLREIESDMHLERHGLKMIRSEPRIFAPSPDGRALLLYTDVGRTAQSIAKLSSKDASRYPDFGFTLDRFAAFTSKLLEETPPTIEHVSPRDLLSTLGLGKAFRSLGRKEMFRLLRWFPMPVADLVCDWFETELIRALIAARGIFGSFAGPRSAGTAAVLLLRAAADPNPAGPACFPIGGMGALTQAMASAAQQAGARLRLGAEVVKVSMTAGEAAGVVLSTGEKISTRMVLSGADPKQTFLRLLDPQDLDPEFIARVQHYRCTGTVAKVNLALAALPEFKALAKRGAESLTGREPAISALSGRIHIGPDLDYLERAFDDAKYGRFSSQPYLEAVIPSLSDPTLAPAGRHVMSIYVQFAPFHLRLAADTTHSGEEQSDNSTGWETQRDALGDTVIKLLSGYAPGLPDMILHRQVITPMDLQNTYGLTGGHIFHGELALDQLFAMRPLLGWAQYRSPVRGLYLCGSGTHPGTGLTGVSGRNAAREVLRTFKRKGTRGS